MHNRARLITAALPDQAPRAWTGGPGRRCFFRWLLDGDVANNSGNWQWVAGTGNDTKPYRGFNPVRQAERFDPDGDYVRRWVPELAEGRRARPCTNRGGCPRPCARRSTTRRPSRCPAPTPSGCADQSTECNTSTSSSTRSCSARCAVAYAKV